MGRVALVTGGGRGIGRAISLELARQGHSVAVNYRRDEEAAKETVAEIKANGGTAQTYLADVSSYDALVKMVDSVAADLGSISILINNAGVASRGLTVADTDPEEPLRVYSVHAVGAHHLSKLVLPQMRLQPRGDIVMISSSAAKRLDANGAPYNMAKAALEALASTLAKEEREHGIRVNTVAPGLVNTEMGRRLVRATRGILNMKELDPTSPFGRVCEPADVAAVVGFLVSDECGYISGEVLHVDGGSWVSPAESN